MDSTSILPLLPPLEMRISAQKGRFEVVKNYCSTVSSFYMNFAHKYVIFMKGDTVDEMAEEALHYVYIYVMLALQEHRRQGRNGEYEAFALQLLAMLQKYRYLYTNPPEAPAPD